MGNLEFFSKEKGDVDKLKERPKVFSEESFGPVLSFASHFDRLRVPVNSEEVEKYKNKYGDCSVAIKPEDLKEISSMAELRNLIVVRVGEVVEKELPQLLEGEEEYKEAIVGAVARKDFEEVDSRDDKKMNDLAVGLSLVAERARTETMKRVLKNLDQELLKKIEITPIQRNVVLDLLEVFPSIDAEFLRFHSRLKSGELLPEQPVDALRERRFVAQKLRDFQDKFSSYLVENKAPLFGSSEKDGGFLRYIKALENAYIPFEANNEHIILSADKQRTSLREAQKEFSNLYAKYPDLPFVVFPAFSHYGADNAIEGSVKSWESFGFDPEVRFYWQRETERSKYVPQFEKIRDKLSNFTADSFSDIVDVSDLRRCQILIGEPLAASGINIKEQTLGQDEDDIVLMVMETPDNEWNEKQQTIFETYLDNPDDLEIVRNESFYHLIEYATLIHEFAHKFYPEKSAAADNLREYDDDLAEYKSELTMWIAGVSVLKEEAERSFGDKATRAIQLAMSREALRQYRTSNMEGEDRPYHIAEREILRTLLENSILIEQNGKLKLSTERFDEDLSSIFSEQYRCLLSIYHQASEGGGEKVLKAANSIIKQKVPQELKIIKR